MLNFIDLFLQFFFRLFSKLNLSFSLIQLKINEFIFEIGFGFKFFQ